MKSLIAIILLLPLYTLAQSNIDSLKSVWNNPEVPDTTRFYSLNKLIWDSYLFNQPDSAFYLANVGYEFAERKGLEKEMATALNIQGISYSLRGDLTKSLDYFKRSLELKNKLGDEIEISKTINNIALIYMKQGNYIEAIEEHNKSLSISEKNNDPKGIARSMINIAILYLKIHDYEKALDYNNRSLELFKELNDKSNIAKCYNNNGIIFLEQGKNKTALKYYLKTLAIEEEQRNEHGIAQALGNIGITYKLLDEYESSLNYQQRSLAIKQRIGDKEGIAKSLISIGSIYQEKGKPDSAIIFCDKAMIIAQETGTPENIASAAAFLYLAYKSKNNYSKALSNLELLNQMEDSLQSERTKKEIIHQEYRNKYEKMHYADSLETIKKLEIEKLEHQKQEFKGKVFHITIYAIITLTIIGVGVFLRIRAIKNKTQKEYLLRENEILKSVAVIHMASSERASILEKHLDRQKIEKEVGGLLNDSDWSVLSLLCENPTINNREISEKISLSFDGVRSSLKKMYRIFDIQNTNENQRMALVIQAFRISDKLQQQ